MKLFIERQTSTNALKFTMPSKPIRKENENTVNWVHSNYEEFLNDEA